eukprot:gene8949-898_t
MSVVQWQWNSNNKWISYDTTTSKYLETQYQMNKKGTCPLNINSNKFVISFSDMTQNSTMSKTKRQIQRIIIQKKSNILWEWCDDYGFCNEFDPFSSISLENSYQKDSNGSTNLKLHGNSYKFDFKNMSQINSSTGKKRKIVRNTTGTPTPFKQQEDKLSFEKEFNVEDKLKKDNFNKKIEFEDEIEDEILFDNKVLWEWEQDGGIFKSFDSSVTSILESNYQKDSNGSTSTQIFGQMYTFTFSDMLQTNTLTKNQRRIARGGNYPTSKIPFPSKIPFSSFQNNYKDYIDEYDDFDDDDYRYDNYFDPYMIKPQYSIPNKTKEENIWEWITKHVKYLNTKNQNSKTIIIPIKFQNYIGSIPIKKRKKIYENLINYTLKISDDKDALLIAIKGLMLRDENPNDISLDIKFKIENEINSYLNNEFNELTIQSGSLNLRLKEDLNEISIEDYLCSTNQINYELIKVTNEQIILNIGNINNNKFEFIIKIKKKKSEVDFKYSIESKENKIKKWINEMNHFLKLNKNIYISIQCLLSKGKESFEKLYFKSEKKNEIEKDEKIENIIINFYKKTWLDYDISNELKYCFKSSIFISKQLQNLNELKMLSRTNKFDSNSDIIIRTIDENPFIWLVQFQNFDSNQIIKDLNLGKDSGSVLDSDSGSNLDSSLGKDLKNHSNKFKTNDESIHLEIKFTVDFPNVPPLIRILRPRIHYLTGDIDIQGFFNSELLTLNGWSNKFHLSRILKYLRQSLIDNNARIDLNHNKSYDSIKNLRKRMEKMKSPMITQNSFTDSFFAFSAQFAKTSFNYFDNYKIENGNNIVLPSNVQSKLKKFGKKQTISTIEIKTDKITSYCGVFQYNAPKRTAIFPTWLMKDLMIEEGSLIDIRSVFLETGSNVVFRPHSKDFWKLQNPILSLENSLTPFSTLNEGQSIPIVGDNQHFMVEIVKLEPSSSVYTYREQDQYLDLKISFETAFDMDDEIKEKDEMIKEDSLFFNIKRTDKKIDSSVVIEEKIEKMNEEKEDGIKCEFCRKLIPENGLTLHSLHCRRNNYICKICDGVIKVIDQKNHDENEHMKCNTCNSIYYSNFTHSCPLKELVPCKLCDKKIEKYKLHDHVKSCKETKEYCKNCGEEMDKNHDCEDEEFGPCACFYCSKKNLSKNSMIMHVLKKHPNDPENMIGTLEFL